MFTATASNPAFPPVDSLLSFLRNVNYRKLANDLITFAATFCAIVVAVSLFVYRNSRAFWAAHGEEITLRFELFIEWLVAAIEKTHQAGMAFRPVAVRLFNRSADWLFYQLTA
jgi:hypothetical protein